MFKAVLSSEEYYAQLALEESLNPKADPLAKNPRCMKVITVGRLPEEEKMSMSIHPEKSQAFVAQTWQDSQWQDSQWDPQWQDSQDPDGTTGDQSQKPHAGSVPTPVAGETEFENLGQGLLNSVSAVVSQATPPNYSEQGQPRGRKPKRSKLDKAKQLGKGKKRSKKTNKVKKNAKKNAKKRMPSDAHPSQVDAVEAVGHVKSKKRQRAASCEASAASAPKAKAKRSAPAEAPDNDVKAGATSKKSGRKTKAKRKASPAEPSVEVALAKEVEEIEIPPDCIDAPTHVAVNSVYSSAYRRAKAATGSDENARSVARLNCDLKLDACEM